MDRNNKLITFIEVQLTVDKQDFSEIEKLLNIKGYRTNHINGFCFFPSFRTNFREEKKLSNYGCFQNNKEKKLMIDSLKESKLVVIGNDWHPLSRRWINAAKILNIPAIVVSYEGLYLDKKRWYNGLCPVSEHVCIWGEDMRQIFLDRGYPDSKMTITGVPRFDKYFNYKPKISKENVFKLLKLDINKPLCTYATQVINDNDLQVVSKDLKALQINKKESLIEILKATKNLDINCWIRLHPTDCNGRDNINYVELLKLYNKEATITGLKKHNEPIPIYDAIYYTDCWISLSSSTNFEAALLNKKSVILNLSKIRDPVPYVNLGISTGIYKKEEIQKTLKNLINTDIDIDSKGLTSFMKKYMIEKLDGKNTERCVQVIEQILNNK